MFHCRFPFFFFNKSSISKLTFLFLGKFSSLLFLITRLSVGLPLSPVSKIEAVEDSPEVDKQRLGGTFTQIIFVSNFSLLLSPSEVPGTEFLYFKRYLPFDDNSVFAEISIVFNFSFIFREMKHKLTFAYHVEWYKFWLIVLLLVFRCRYLLKISFNVSKWNKWKLWKTSLDIDKDFSSLTT